MTDDGVAIADYVAALDKALAEMDLNFIRNQLGKPVSDEMAELVAHKARYEATRIAPELRHASAAWLRERGYGRLNGPLLPEGELPA